MKFLKVGELKYKIDCVKKDEFLNAIDSYIKPEERRNNGRL